MPKKPLTQVGLLVGLSAGLSLFFTPHAVEAFPMIMLGPLTFSGESVITTNPRIWLAGPLVLLAWWRLGSSFDNGRWCNAALYLWPLAGCIGIIRHLLGALVT